MRNFREYDIWRSAIRIAKVVYEITASFPPSEKYGLSSQIQRASVSISSNIAEGCSRYSETDFARFLEISLGSTFEVENQMILAAEFGYVTEEQLNDFAVEIAVLQKQINTLITKIRHKPMVGSQQPTANS